MQPLAGSHAGKPGRKSWATRMMISPATKSEVFTTSWLAMKAVAASTAEVKFWYRRGGVGEIAADQGV